MNAARCRQRRVRRDRAPSVVCAATHARSAKSSQVKVKSVKSPAYNASTAALAQAMRPTRTGEQLCRICVPTCSEVRRAPCISGLVPRVQAYLPDLGERSTRAARYGRGIFPVWKLNPRKASKRNLTLLSHADHACSTRSTLQCSDRRTCHYHTCARTRRGKQTRPTRGYQSADLVLLVKDTGRLRRNARSLPRGARASPLVDSLDARTLGTSPEMQGTPRPDAMYRIFFLLF